MRRRQRESKVLRNRSNSETETFYYYGPGGGGVAYANRHFLDVRGKTLSITFEAGPSNIPSPETRTIEKPLLQTFRTF